MKGRCNTSGENVKAEVEYQTPVITQILEGLVGKAQGANATADKILEGYSAYVGQVLVEGTAKPRIAGLDYGELTLASETNSITVAHNLGAIPTQIVVLSSKADCRIAINYYNDYGVFLYGSAQAVVATVSKNANSFTITSRPGYPFNIQDYKWIALA